MCLSVRVSGSGARDAAGGRQRRLTGLPGSGAAILLSQIASPALPRAVRTVRGGTTPSSRLQDQERGFSVSAEAGAKRCGFSSGSDSRSHRYAS